MQRRDFLKLTAAVSVASALPLWSRSVFAASRPSLPVPELLTADARNRISLIIQAGKTQFGSHLATTWGYNGNLFGPALQLRAHHLLRGLSPAFTETATWGGWWPYRRSGAGHRVITR